MGDITACIELMLCNEWHQPIFLERELFFSVSLSILFMSARLRFNSVRVSKVHGVEAVRCRATAAMAMRCTG